MKVTKELAMQIWQNHYGFKEYAYDFDGGLMYKGAYGDSDYFVNDNGDKIYCGWNLHHILPKAKGGKTNIDNLVCTNIITNDEAGDKITYWINGSLYQVKKKKGTSKYQIVCVNSY